MSHNENSSNAKQPVNPQGGCDSSDEIDLVDLWLLLARHKILIFLLILVFTGAGIGVSFWLPGKYTFSTSIDVGRVFSEGADGTEGNVALIEPIETIQAKLTESYIPMVLGQFATENQLKKAGLKVSVSIPKGSHLLVLQSRGTLESQGLHREVHEAVLAALQEDHRQLTDDLKKRLETALAKASLKLAELEDPRLFAIREKELKDQIDSAKLSVANLENPRLFAVKEKNLKEEIENAKRDLVNLTDPRLIAIKEKALKERIDNARRNLAGLTEKREMISVSIKDLEKLRTMLEAEALTIRESIEKNLATRNRAATETDNAASAMTLLMMDSQIQQNQTRLQAIQERLNLGLVAERRQLEKDLNDNWRAAEAQTAEIEQLELQKTQLAIDHELEVTEAKQTVDQLDRQYIKLTIDHENELTSAKQPVAQLERQLTKLAIDHENEVTEHKQTITELEHNISLIKNTKALALAVRSVEPVGARKSMVVVLSCMFGGMLGIFLAFGAEFRQRVRAKALAMKDVG